VLVVALLGTLGFAVASAASEQPTAVHHYAAFKAGRIAPGLTVKDTVRGECWTESSHLHQRRFAWRCSSRKGIWTYIYDPCLALTPRSSFVVCPERPWRKRVTIMRMTEPLPTWKRYKSRRYVPWGIWTTAGKRCYSLSHWQSEIAGRRVTHYCDGGGVLTGFADRRHPTWKIYYGASLRSKRVTLVGISDAWW